MFAYKDRCELSHVEDLVFVPFFKSDLYLLARYISTKGKTEITERLAKTIFEYLNKN